MAYPRKASAMTGRLCAEIATAKQLAANEQEQLAALWERDDVRWRELFQRSGAHAVFDQLRAEAAEAERGNTLEDSPNKGRA
jgi:hypothetical protein